MIINAVLCYAIHSLNSSAPDNCKRTLINYYDIDEIIDAKKALWGAVSSDDIGKYEDRRSSVNRPAKVENVNDIFNALKHLDKIKKTPVFVVQDLDRIPSNHPEELNHLMLIQRLENLEKCRDTHNEILSQLCIDLINLQDGTRPNDATYDNQQSADKSYSDAVASNITNKNDNAAIIPQIVVTPPTNSINVETPSDNTSVINSDVNSHSTESDANNSGHSRNSNVSNNGNNNNVNNNTGNNNNGNNDNNANSNTNAPHNTSAGAPPLRANMQPPRTGMLPTIEGRRWGPPANSTNYNNRRRNSHYQDPHRDRSNSSSNSYARGYRGPSYNNRGSHNGGQRGSYHRSSGNVSSDYNNRHPPRMDQDGFITVQRRRPRRQITYGNGMSTGGLSGAPLPIRQIWVSRLTNGSNQRVKDYIESRNVKVFNIEKVSHNEAQYSSYKVTISVADKNNVFDPLFWPTGVKCQWWYDRTPEPEVNNDINNSNNNNSDTDGELP